MPVTGASLIGREAAMARVTAAVDAVTRGMGGCLIIDGPAGIGKSRLLAEAGSYARSRGVVVAAGRARELDRVAPLHPLLRALRGSDPPVLTDEAAGRLAEHRDSAYWLLDRLNETLEEFTARRPLLVVLDDAHWSDELTALALHTLVPSLRCSSLQWLLACRPRTAQTHARDTLDGLIAEGADTLTLEPLTEAQVGAFCREILGGRPDERVLAMARRGGGNPFLLERLLTTLTAEGAVVVQNDEARLVTDDLPAAFVRAVDLRLRDLSDPARRLLEVAAVLGRPFTVHEAAGLADVPAVQLVSAAHEATQAGTLIGSGTELAFRHDLLRDAVYHGLPGPVRQALHREAARVLRAEGRPATQVAEHLMRGARPGDHRAVEALREAADEIAAWAPDTAAGILRRAMELLDSRHAREREDLAARAVRLLAVSGRVAQARELGDEVLAAGVSPAGEAAILLGLAEALKHAGEDEGVLKATARALSRSDIPAAARAHLLAVRAHGLLYVDQMDAADQAGATAIEVGTTCGEPSAVVWATVARCVVAYARGQVHTAISLGREAVRLADEAAGQTRHRHPRLWLGRALVAADQLTDAYATFDAGQREADRSGTAWSLPLWHYYRAELHLAAGRLDEAATEAETALRVSERLGARALAIPTLSMLAQTALRRDDPPAAQEHLREAKRLYESGIGALPEDLAWAQAQLHDARDDPSAAVRALEPVFAALPERLMLFVQDPWAGPQLIRIALRAGTPGLAQSAANAIRQVAEQNPDVVSAAAAAAHAEGLLNKDRAALGAAVDAYRASPRRLAAASAMEDAAAAERAAGQRATAIALLDEAQGIYAEAGARRDHARVSRALRGLGVRRRTTPPAEPRSGWESLTPAEVRVVRLVAEGLTNRATAATLYLSPHTVDTHLRHAFAKLGVSSRVELTRYVLERDRVAAGSGGIT